jgi:beta-barrel assembly-enhancing protease
VAHVTKRHSIRHQIAAAGPALLFRVFLGGGGGFAGLLSGGSELLVERSFSQDYETEADDAAWDYLLAARIDPRGLAGMLRKLQEVEERDRFLDIPQAFSTHPATSKRIKRLDAKWRKLKNPPEFIELPKLPPKS